jgi:hypothetical protein
MATAEDFSVIVGDFNDAFVEIVAETVTEALDPCHRLRVHGTSEVDRILVLAGERPVDLFVLFLNNMTFGKWGSDLEADSFIKALILVRHLKLTHGMPIIAIRVGADRFFRMPFEMKTFTKAVRTLFPGRARLETGLSSAPLSTFRAGRPGFNA